jgi:hypothetical protein
MYWIPACAGMTENGQNFGFTQALYKKIRVVSSIDYYLK